MGGRRRHRSKIIHSPTKYHLLRDCSRGKGVRVPSVFSSMRIVTHTRGAEDIHVVTASIRVTFNAGLMKPRRIFTPENWGKTRASVIPGPGSVFFSEPQKKLLT